MLLRILTGFHGQAAFSHTNAGGRHHSLGKAEMRNLQSHGWVANRRNLRQNSEERKEGTSAAAKVIEICVFTGF